MRRFSLRSRRDEESESFDLLLDTMCNTFGGILFIALFLSVLSNSVSSIGKSAVIDKAAAGGYIEKLEKAKKNVEIEAREKIAVRKLKRAEQLITSTHDEIGKIKRSIAALEDKIFQYSKPDFRKLRLPRLHPVKKNQVFIAIRANRFYNVTDLSYAISYTDSSSWPARGYDRSDILIGEFNGGISVEPLAGRGQPVEKGAESEGRIAAALMNINREREIVTFAVYTDSFRGFNYLKEIFIKRGFDYNWYIIQDQFLLVRGSGSVHAQ